MGEGFFGWWCVGWVVCVYEGWSNGCFLVSFFLLSLLLVVPRRAFFSFSFLESGWDGRPWAYGVLASLGRKTMLLVSKGTESCISMIDQCPIYGGHR